MTHGLSLSQCTCPPARSMIVTCVLHSPDQPTIPCHMLALKLTVSIVFSPSVRLLSGREALPASCTPDNPLYPLESRMNRVSFLIDLESIHLHVCKLSDLLNENQFVFNHICKLNISNRCFSMEEARLCRSRLSRISARSDFCN